MIAVRELLHADPVLAAAIGYIIGSIVSYTLNRLVTFRSSRNHRQALWRFALVNVAGFVLTTLLMAIFVKTLGVNYLVSRLVTTAAIFGMNFLSHRFWTFQSPETRTVDSREG
jgi:putative flippase GtrA